MSVIRWIKALARKRVANLVRSEVQQAFREALPLVPQFVEAYHAPPECRHLNLDHTKDPLANASLYADLRDRLAAAGVRVEDAEIDVNGFRQWLDSFPEVRDHYRVSGAAWIEKCLEHYLAYSHLHLSRGDVYIDVAAAGSPWAEIVAKRGIRTYRLDRTYPPGVHGTQIGADATRTGLPDGFANALSSQCAFECFAGDADVGFFPEAARILAPGGRLAVCPLYLDDTHFNVLDPYVDARRIPLDPGATKVWRGDGIPSDFARHYSPEAFQDRVYKSLSQGFAAKVLYFGNVPDLMAEFPGQIVYCFFLLYAERRVDPPESGQPGTPA